MEQIYKVGKLENIANIDLKIEKVNYTTNKYQNGKSISEEKTCLSFYTGNDDYGFNFYSNISPKEFLEFEMNKRVDFRDYMQFDDFDYGVDGKPAIIDSVKSEIIHYLDNKFMIVIYIMSDSSASHIQIDFDISEFLD